MCFGLVVVEDGIGWCGQTLVKTGGRRLFGDARDASEFLNIPFALNFFLLSFFLTTLADSLICELYSRILIGKPLKKPLRHL